MNSYIIERKYYDYSDRETYALKTLIQSIPAPYVDVETPLQKDVKKYRNRVTLKKFKEETGRACLNVYGCGDCWWRCPAFILFGNNELFKEVKQIIMWFLIMPTDIFGKVFGTEKITARNMLLEFLQFTNILDLVLKVYLTKGAYAEYVYVDLLILSIVWPEKKFCVLTFAPKNQNLQACIGERENGYYVLGDFPQKDIPTPIHDLFRNIYMGTQLVVHLNTETSTFNYEGTNDVNFIY